MKALLRVLLLLLAGATSVVAVARVSGFTRPPAATAEAPDHWTGVLVTNFHGDIRCETCVGIGRMARAVVESEFAPDLAAGRLRWRTANFDQPQHASAFEQYGLVSSSVVVSVLREGRERSWRNMDEVWTLHEKPDAFRELIRQQVKECLQALPGS